MLLRSMSAPGEHVNATYDERKFTSFSCSWPPISKATDPGGATKLNKILFFADFAHVRCTGVPVTGATFQKLEPRSWSPEAGAQKLEPRSSSMVRQLATPSGSRSTRLEERGGAS